VDWAWDGGLVWLSWLWQSKRRAVGPLIV